MKLRFKIKNEEHSKAVQLKLMELGYDWCVGRGKDPRHLRSNYIFANIHNKDLTSGSTSGLYTLEEVTDTTLDDLFDTQFEVVEFKLNAEYSAFINEKSVTVGCQTFPNELIFKFITALDAVHNPKK